MNSFLSILAAATILGATTAQAADLNVTISGLRPDKSGQIVIGVFDKETDFPKTPRRELSAVMTVTEAGNFTLENIPAGEYAIAIFHDENSNNKIDGFPPTEGYAFSNDARGTFGPPSWKKAKFAVTEPGTAIAIEMKY